MAFSPIFPDLEEEALRQGLCALLAGEVERFRHTYVVETALGPRPRRYEISLLRLGRSRHFMTVPDRQADAGAATAAMERALREAHVTRPRIEREYVVATAAGDQWRVRVTPIRLGRSAHLIAFPGGLDDSAAAERLLLAQEEERHRIAIELHDSTSQHLVAISLGLARLRRFVRASRAERRVLEDMSNVIQDAIREIRTFSYLMNPPQLERDGLEATVRRFVEGFQARTGVATSVTVEGAPDDSNEAARHTLFRVLQEVCTNVHRRAKASHLDVELALRDGWLTLTVRDDAPAESSDMDQLVRAPIGVGIAGMRAPVIQLGGSLRVLSGADGEQVVARLPAEAARRAR